jgi:hypothetical protein
MHTHSLTNDALRMGAGPMAVDKQSARLDPGAQHQCTEIVSPARPVVKTAREAATARYSAGSLAASAGTTSFTAPRQPEWVRSNTTPSGPLNLTS